MRSQYAPSRMIWKGCASSARRVAGASSPSASTCRGRKLMPSCVEPRGSTGSCRQRSVRGRVDLLMRSSDTMGSASRPAAAAPSATVLLTRPNPARRLGLEPRGAHST